MTEIKIKPNLTKHFIDGKFVETKSSKRFPTINPATGKVICEVSLGDALDVDAAVFSARKAFLNSNWKMTSLKERSDLLHKIGDKILEQKQYLAELESLDTGKPISETLNGDIPRAASNFKFFADLCLQQPNPSFVSEDGSTHKARREPIGVCALITPWNLPLYLTTWKLAPALAQGNTVVIKPAELTPLSAAALGEIIDSVGVPKGVVNIVQGFGEDSAGEALVRHPDVACVSFTGETTTGKAIMADASTTLKKLSFELGGKGASVIFSDADLSKACPTAIKAAFRNQGQICLAGSRLLVEETIASEVIERLLTEINKIVIGDPLDPKTTMGSLISTEHRDRVASYVELARKTPGCKILCGGKIPEKLNREGAFYEPTLIAGVKQDSRLIQEEIFGPVLTVQTFSDAKEALALLNGTKYGLSCSIWTSSSETADFMAGNARFGMVWLNSWFLRNLNTPFGGMKNSGIGREGGQYSLDFFSDWKTITYS